MKKISTLILAASLSFTVNASEKIRVYAASSMTNAITELSESYTKQTGVNIINVFGGSSSLARQIEQGAPADVFISANKKWVEHLVKSEHIKQNNVVKFASNSLVLVTPKTSNIKFNVTNSTEWINTLNGSRLAIGQPDTVPAGIYSKETLKSLNVWEQLKTELAPTKNVRVALVLVELAESPLGIVYKTDAMASHKVIIAHNFDDSMHSPITYPLAQITETATVDGFIEFLKTDKAQRIIESYGFK